VLVALVGDFVSIVQICADGAHCLAKDRKGLEHFGAFQIGKDSLPIADDVIVSVGRVGDWSQNVFGLICDEGRDHLIQIQINETRRLLVALGAFLFRAWREQNAPENGETQNVISGRPAVGRRTWVVL
jgi:hypothetical protein